MAIVYLISGANRGLGLGFVKVLLSRPNSDAVVFAGARDPSLAHELNALTNDHPDRLHVVKLTSADAGSNNSAVETIRRVAGRLDVVIANAGFGRNFGPVSDVPLSEFLDHYETNVGGPLVLFQSSLPLLVSSSRPASSPPPKFVIISSLGGSIEIGPGFPGIAAYGTSKAAINWLCKKIHVEHEKDGLVAFSMDPGVVDTEGLRAHDHPVVQAFPKITPVESATKILGLIDGATRDNFSGKFVGVEGEIHPW